MRDVSHPEKTRYNSWFVELPFRKPTLGPPSRAATGNPYVATTAASTPPGTPGGPKTGRYQWRYRHSLNQRGRLLCTT
jgi:hypothetical protein